jgi:hypothetical protein
LARQNDPITDAAAERDLGAADFAIILGLHAAVTGPGAAFCFAHRYRRAARDAVTPVVCAAIGGTWTRS